MTSFFCSGPLKDSFFEQRKIAESALEKLDSIKIILEQRDELRRKLQSSQSEFDALKRQHEITCQGDFDGKDLLTKTENSNDLRSFNKLENLENDVKNLMSVKDSSEAEGIMKEIMLLKTQYSKLSHLENENKELKLKLNVFENLNKQEGPNDFTIEPESISVKDPENHYTVEEFKIYKYRSQLLDEILRDRDRLSKKLEEYSKTIEDYSYIKERNKRMNDLEDQLELALKEKLSMEEELELMKCKFLYMELDLLNRKAEVDNLNSKISCLEQEKEFLVEEKEKLKQENDNLQKTFKDSSQLQIENQLLKDQMRLYQVLKEEREMYKLKYEQLIGLECEVDILRAQLAKAKIIENEQDLLENQVENFISE